MDSIKGPTHKTLGLSHLLIPQLDHGHCQFSVSFTHKHSHSPILWQVCTLLMVVRASFFMLSSEHAQKAILNLWNRERPQI